MFKFLGKCQWRVLSPHLDSHHEDLATQSSAGLFVQVGCDHLLDACCGGAVEHVLIFRRQRRTLVPTLTTEMIGLRMNVSLWQHTSRERSITPFLKEKTWVTISRHFIALDTVAIPMTTGVPKEVMQSSCTRRFGPSFLLFGNPARSLVLPRRQQTRRQCSGASVPSTCRETRVLWTWPACSPLCLKDLQTSKALIIALVRGHSRSMGHLRKYGEVNFAFVAQLPVTMSPPWRRPCGHVHEAACTCAQMARSTFPFESNQECARVENEMVRHKEQCANWDFSDSNYCCTSCSRGYTTASRQPHETVLCCSTLPL